MRKFFEEYLKLFAYATLGLAFIIGSFYLLINVYHAKEIDKKYYISDTESTYTSYKSKLEKIKINLNTYNKNKNKNSDYLGIYTRLSTCSNLLESDGTLAKMETNKYYDSYDVYKLGQKFEGSLLNSCWVVQLSYLTTDAGPEAFKEIIPFVSREVDAINDKVEFALEELENNGSYFYSTGITSSTIRNYLRADYMAIAKSYNDFADVVLELSKIINKEETKTEIPNNTTTPTTTTTETKDKNPENAKPIDPNQDSIISGGESDDKNIQ